MLDIFMFIFVHSIVELASDFHVDVCGLMVSLVMCAYVGPFPPPGHQRQVVTVPSVAASAEAPSGNSHRWHVLCLGPDVPTGYSTLAEQVEDYWHWFLLWLLPMCFLL